jgi:TolB-like protein/tetratricopeptide (TPR) repeat protein
VINPIERLASALSDRYKIERELGAGGMATVYLAEDLKHHRQVAVKILRPELAAVLGPERFLREIEIAAKLNHPHILPLHDSGEADGFLYYVMPHVEGESLRDKINREKQLAIDEAIRITEQVSSTLDYAHRQGVIHRDIKPENVLLHEGVAMVMDFGIALAVSHVSGARLTETGLSIGTPAYMSPEQVSGEHVLDGRCDVYSLGAVLYEMLTGETPYTGATAQVIMARQFTDPVPSARRIRSSVPAQVDTALQRALAKAPADRWTETGQFARDLRADLSTRDSRERRASGAVGRRRIRIAALALATVLAAGAAWWWIPRPSALRLPDTDPTLLAVLPFEVRGSDEFAYLREGMVDLVSTKLDGVGGLRVVDPHTSLALVSEASAGPTTTREARRLSATLGAGRALQGSVLRLEGSLQVRASVYGPGDDDRIDASVDGPADRLFELVDELVGTLVARGLIGEETPLSSLEGLTTNSNEALRLYLTGIQNFRAGRGMQEDFGLLTQAVGLDSTFALASYWAGYIAAYDEIEDPEPHFQLALRHQDRLGQRDRMRLAAALAGAEGRQADAIRLYEAFVERYSDDLAGWFQLGEQLAHTGHFRGRTLAEARPAYERAIALDPALAPAYYHLSHIGGLQGDSLALRVWATRLVSLGVDSLWIALPDFARAVIVGDSLGIRQPFDRIRAAEPDIPPATLAGSMGQLLGATLEHAPRQSRALIIEFAARAFTDTARTVAARRAARIESASGRFAAAENALRNVERALGTALPQDLAWIALHPANRSAERIEAASRVLSGVSPRPRTGEAAARHYLLARLALRLGRNEALERSRAALRDFEPESREIGRFAGDLATELDAIAARAGGDPMRALESLLEATYWERAQSWLGFPEPTYFDGRLPDRFPMFLRAELLREAGQDSAAAAWYRVAADGVWHRGPALLRLAEIRARQGASEEAANLYRRVRALWADGDAELEEVLDQINARLAR